MVRIFRISTRLGSHDVALEGSSKEFKEIVSEFNDITQWLDDTGKVVSVKPVKVDSLLPDIPTISNTGNILDAIKKLFDTPWGNTPRTLSEIKEALASNGLPYPTTALSGPLLKLNKRSVLRRWRGSSGYLYTKGIGLTKRVMSIEES